MSQAMDLRRRISTCYVLCYRRLHVVRLSGEEMQEKKPQSSHCQKRWSSYSLYEVRPDTLVHSVINDVTGWRLARILLAELPEYFTFMSLLGTHEECDATNRKINLGLVDGVASIDHMY